MLALTIETIESQLVNHELRGSEYGVNISVSGLSDNSVICGKWLKSSYFAKSWN